MCPVSGTEGDQDYQHPVSAATDVLADGAKGVLIEQH